MQKREWEWSGRDRASFVAVSKSLDRAPSKLARNIFLYAGTGTVTVREVERTGRKGIEVTCEDQGPGIPNIALVMQDGYSTGGGLGSGLPAVRRLMDEFQLASDPHGTRIVAIKWHR